MAYNFCEIAFWFVILLGLVTRYILNQQTLGLFFLALTPIIDLILIITTVVDLMNGAMYLNATCYSKEFIFQFLLSLAKA